MKQIMRCAIILTGMALALPAYGEIVDAVVATVDAEPILHSEIMDMIAPSLRELQATGATEEQFQRRANDLARDALEQAVENRILGREAQLAGIQVDEQWVNEQVDGLKKDLGSESDLQHYFETTGETLAEVREHLGQRYLALRMAKAKQSQFEKEAVVTEADVARYYEENRDLYNRPERAHIRQIFLIAPADNAQQRTATRTRIEALRKELDAGADFGALAQAHSEAPGAEQGGVVGWQMRGDLIEPLNSAAFSLAEGQMSDVVESPNGFHILLVDQREEAGQASLDEVRTEIAAKLRANIRDELYRNWMNEQRKRRRVRIYM